MGSRFSTDKAIARVGSRTRVMVVFGTRPEAIKLAPVINALQKSAILQPRVCVTGQHREMLDQMLGMFDILPDHDLAVMQHNQSLGALTGRVLTGLQEVFATDTPGAVVVQGDTTTTFATALAAFYQRIPVGHVEAGLRTGNIYNPFPEEMNRRLATRLTTWHFAPTPHAAESLLAEGIPASAVLTTGNTIVDALQHIGRRLEQDAHTFQLPSTTTDLSGRRLIVVTGHRRESFGDGFRNICCALRQIVEHHHDVLIVYPVHLNPSVQAPVYRMLSNHPRIILTAPMNYLPFVDLLRHAYLILTDSGGVQEEAPSLRVPVLVMRETTERPEGIVAGVAKLVGTKSETIVAMTGQLLDDPAAHARMVASRNPYGDGTAADAIVSHLERVLGGEPSATPA